MKIMSVCLPHKVFWLLFCFVFLCVVFLLLFLFCLVFLVGGRFNNQGNLHTRLALVASRDESISAPASQKALTKFRHGFGPAHLYNT